MAIPYQTPPATLTAGRAAFLAVMEHRRRLLAGLLVIDGLGRPIEFVHNAVAVPAGPWWSRPTPRLLIPELVHTLFDACSCEPDLLVCEGDLTDAEHCRAYLAPAIPCCRLSPSGGDPAALRWEWLNAPPEPGLRAAALAAELPRRGLAAEPFERLREGLRHVYETVPER